MLVFARCLALVLTVPLFSTRTIPRIAKIAFTFYIAYFLYSTVSLDTGPFSAYASFIDPAGRFNLTFVFLLVGEAMIGLIMGFFISMIFAAFSTAGQFFAFQMGFSMSSAYDALSQVENPLLGQYFNLLAMLVFLQNRWFMELFFRGLGNSFDSINVFSILSHSEQMVQYLLSGFSGMFRNAFVISLPIMAILLLINISMGVLAKAAPQMNLLSEGYPILIMTGIFVMSALLPSFMEFFNSSFQEGFSALYGMFSKLGVATS